MHNRPEDASTNYHNQLYTETINQKNQHEEMTYPSYDNNELLNYDTKLEEFERVVKNKGCGFDCIPNEC